MVKAVRDLGLPIGRVVFDGIALSVVIGDERPLISIEHAIAPPVLLREPKL